MDLLELMKERYSVRNFSDKKVEQEKIDRILEAAKAAPTACNRQPVKIFVLNEKESLERWQKCTACHFNEQLVIITCYDRNEIWTREFDGQNSGDVDASIVMTHMMLEAWEQGIGSTWLMYFIPEALRKEFNISDNLVPSGVLAMGYASSEAKPSAMHMQRKDISEFVEYNR